MSGLAEALGEAIEAANEAGRPELLERLVDGLMEIARESGKPDVEEDER